VLEVVVVMTIMGVLIAIPTPMFLKTIEQSKLDVAAANLRAIWCAQRYYFLEHQTYASDLATLVAENLLDPSIAAGPTFYQYAVAAADESTFSTSFVATATHPAGSSCSGSIAIDSQGNLTCDVVYANGTTLATMTPSLEPTP
jgi:Tfp pilus assembly protein PilE